MTSILKKENNKINNSDNQKTFYITHEKKKHLLISFSFLIILTLARILGVWSDQKPLKKLKNIFSNMGFNIGFCLVLIWSVFILGFGGANYFTSDAEIYNSYIESTKKAILAIIIAIFAKIELIIPVFWLVWLSAFYLEGWS